MEWPLRAVGIKWRCTTRTSSTCSRSAAYTVPTRSPGLRRGPAINPSRNMAIPPVLEFFRAVHSNPSFTVGHSTSDRDVPYVLRQHHRLARQWMPRRHNQPLPTPRHQQDQPHPPGRTSGGVSGGVNAAARFSSRRRSLKRRWRSRLDTAAVCGFAYGIWCYSRFWAGGYGSQETQIPTPI